jgi:type I restriction enzyme M protein
VDAVAPKPGETVCDPACGTGETVRRKRLHECDVHTLLRLPARLCYAQGVKANVLFFGKKPASETPWTRKLWIYDLRTNVHFTLKTNPLQRADLDEFVACYNTSNRHDRNPTWSEDPQAASPAQSDSFAGRWRAYTFDELTVRDKASLDIFWLRDESLEGADDLPESPQPPDHAGRSCHRPPHPAASPLISGKTLLG